MPPYQPKGEGHAAHTPTSLRERDMQHIHHRVGMVGGGRLPGIYTRVGMVDIQQGVPLSYHALPGIPCILHVYPAVIIPAGRMHTAGGGPPGLSLEETPG